MAVMEFLRAFVGWPLLFATPWITTMTVAAHLFPSAGGALAALSFLGGMILGSLGVTYGIGRLR